MIRHMPRDLFNRMYDVVYPEIDEAPEECKSGSDERLKAALNTTRVKTDDPAVISLDPDTHQLLLACFEVGSDNADEFSDNDWDMILEALNSPS